MKRIAIIAYETNPAVCSSMMMHVEMMHEAGFTPILYVRQNVPELFFEPYSYEKKRYASFKELKKLLYTDSVNAVWCTTALYLTLLKLNGICQPIFLWQQGDGPAESYMHHHNKIRVLVLRGILKNAFKKAAGVIFVSDSMRDYYVKEYGFNNPYAVIPCLSEFAGMERDVERIPDSYVYIGGLSVWQCFDEILYLYKKIRTNNSVFHIITHDTEAARAKVDKILGTEFGIEIYSITDRGKIPSILNKFQYGFLIRKNDVVNLVSSPIKFLEYLSCGVDVVMTDAVPAYAQIVKDNHVGTVVNLYDEEIRINKYSNQAKAVYKKLFNRNIYIERYKKLIQI